MRNVMITYISKKTVGIKYQQVWGLKQETDSREY